MEGFETQCYPWSQQKVCEMFGLVVCRTLTFDCFASNRIRPTGISGLALPSAGHSPSDSSSERVSTSIDPVPKW